MWKPEWVRYLESLEKIYAVVEPDGGGKAFRDKLAATSAVKDRLHLVDLGEHKDASGLHCADPDTFEDHFNSALRNATPHAQFARAEAEVASRQAWSACKDLVLVPNLLDRFATDFAALGVAGESRIGKVVYLAVTSRLLPKPVSVDVKGPSSGGKSYTVEQVLRFFPDSAYYALTAMSERALAYSEEPLKHRILTIFEASGMEGDMQTYLIRSLLSEGRIRYEVVEKTSEGMKPRLIEREGPTGLLVTTTAPRLHPEKRDAPALANRYGPPGSDPQRPRRARRARRGQPRSGTGPRRVAGLAGLVRDAGQPAHWPLRRAPRLPGAAHSGEAEAGFGALLNLIRAHAVLHRATRETEQDGRVVATVEDYARVRELVAALVSQGVEAAVPPTVRKTESALNALHAEEGEPVMITEIAKRLELNKSSAWRRVRIAMERGYAKNLKDGKGRPVRLVPGDTLLADIEILPAPERLLGCTVAGVQ